MNVSISSGIVPAYQGLITTIIQIDKKILLNCMCSYEKLIPLHRKWQAYIAKLLIGTNTLRDVQERLYNAEVVGSLFNVSACKHIQMEGQSGIVLKESSSAFHIFTAYNKHIIVPKKGSTFEFALPSRKKVVTLSGDALIQRAGGGTITY